MIILQVAAVLCHHFSHHHSDPQTNCAERLILQGKTQRIAASACVALIVLKIRAIIYAQFAAHITDTHSYKIHLPPQLTVGKTRLKQPIIMVDFRISSYGHDGHGGYGGATNSVHIVFKLAGALVHVDSRGRLHSVTVSFRFFSPSGKPCTSEEWLSSRQASNAPLIRERTGYRYHFASAGLQINVSTSGRSASAWVDVYPEGSVNELPSYIRFCETCRYPEIDVMNPAPAACDELWPGTYSVRSRYSNLVPPQ
jgi:hypothetical protein